MKQLFQSEIEALLFFYSMQQVLRNLGALWKVLPEWDPLRAMLDTANSKIRGTPILRIILMKKSFVKEWKMNSSQFKHNRASIQCETESVLSTKQKRSQSLTAKISWTLNKIPVENRSAWKVIEILFSSNLSLWWKSRFIVSVSLSLSLRFLIERNTLVVKQSLFMWIVDSNEAAFDIIQFSFYSESESTQK